MKLSAIVTSLVIGLSSTVALAAPWDQNHRAPSVRDHRVEPAMQRPAYVRPPVQPRWTSLAASHVRNGRQVINVSSPARFTKLKIEATRGATKIDTVLITFANGRTQRVELDTRIGMNTGPALIDLQGRDRQISKIVILTKGNARSSFAVLGA